MTAPPAETPVFETNLAGLTLLRRGKVRDIYDLGELLLIVATDRLSAFDVVMPTPVPLKGKVLTQISNYWFNLTADLVPNHLVAVDVRDFPPACRPHAALLDGRAILVRKTAPLAIECVARGYLSGSGWNEYRAQGTVCGVGLPPGLVESAQLPASIFTPATKAEEGHDENIDFDRAAAIVGGEIAAEARRLTLAIYERARVHAAAKGIIIADTKMEFGTAGGALVLIDELLTPDSSRFWPAASYRPGGPQESFDKQYVRDYLLAVGFNRRPPGPALPADVVAKTSRLYRNAMIALTGRDVAGAP